MSDQLDALNCLAATAGQIEETEKRSTKIDTKNKEVSEEKVNKDDQENSESVITSKNSESYSPSYGSEPLKPVASTPEPTSTKETTSSFSNFSADVLSSSMPPTFPYYSTFLNEIRSSNAKNIDYEALKDLFDAYVTNNRQTASSTYSNNFYSTYIRPPSFNISKIFNTTQIENPTFTTPPFYPMTAPPQLFEAEHSKNNPYLPETSSESFYENVFKQTWPNIQDKRFIPPFAPGLDLHKQYSISSKPPTLERNSPSSMNNNHSMTEQGPNEENNSLFSTLVEESQKILSSHDGDGKSAALKQFEEMTKASIPKSSTPSPISGPFQIPMVENSLQEEPTPKKPIKKRKGRPFGDNKRSGPVFNPSSKPPKENTPESALCVLHEHTLLKMATRGFWNGDRGPLQDIFRLARVENSDLQYTMDQITEHCYNMVKERIQAKDADKHTIGIHMKNYVEEFDSYLDRIYPVSSVAMNVYLPTAADYEKATWHGVVPTGWSEYRRAVVIREVFEILYHISNNTENIPDYSSKYFDKPKSDPLLHPIKFMQECREKESELSGEKERMKEDNTEKQNESKEPEESKGSKETNEKTESNETKEPNETKESNKIEFDKASVRYSRAFEALWRRLSPVEPYLILEENTELKFGSYLERYPLELHAPSNETIIVVDGKKYRAKDVLGFFRRGVQIVDYSNNDGVVVDTVSTIRNFTINGAVRKIPPGKISKLIHQDLHLENYTHTILEIGQDPSEVPPRLPVVAKIRTRKRKSKLSQDQISKANKEPHIISTEPISINTNDLSNKRINSVASFCEALSGHNFLDVHNFTTNIKTEPKAFQPFPNTIRPPFSDPGHSIQSLLPNYSNIYSMKNEPSANQRINETIEVIEERERFVNQETQTTQESFPSPPGHLPTFDILSSMQLPFNTTDTEAFSLRIMIDSYRRAAKYLLDTANHLELVARRNSNKKSNKKENKNNHDKNNNNTKPSKNGKPPKEEPTF